MPPFRVDTDFGSDPIKAKIAGAEKDRVHTMLVIGGMLMVLLGFIGVYVGYIFQEVKRRPTYLIRREKNDE